MQGFFKFYSKNSKLKFLFAQDWRSTKNLMIAENICSFQPIMKQSGIAYRIKG